MPARKNSARSAAGQPTRPYIDTATAIERFRNGRSIFTPPPELAAATAWSTASRSWFSDDGDTRVERYGGD